MKTLILIFTIIISCNNQDKNSLYPSTRLLEIHKYGYEDKSFKQVVDVEFLSEMEISFRILTFDKENNKSSTVQGHAQRKIDQDPEQDENEKGIPYSAIQYIYTNGECIILIRISKDRKDLLKLDTFRCENLMGIKDGLFSLKILLKRMN